jgi:hypothetical protein
MEVSVQLHALSALSPEKKPRYPLDRWPGCYGKEKSLVSARNRTPTPRSSNLHPNRYTDWANPALLCFFSEMNWLWLTFSLGRLFHFLFRSEHIRPLTCFGFLSVPSATRFVVLQLKITALCNVVRSGSSSPTFRRIVMLQFSGSRTVRNFYYENLNCSILL